MISSGLKPATFWLAVVLQPTMLLCAPLKVVRKYNFENYENIALSRDHLCGLVVRVLGYRSGGPGSIPGTTRKKKVVALERGPLSLVSTTEELFDRKVAAPV
jgi:hypothetical protein